MKTTVTVLILLTLFSLNTPAQDVTRSIPKGSISGNIAYSPDGTRLAVAGNIGIWFYDTATYQYVALLTGHTGAVKSVAFSPDGNTLASGTEYGKIILWELTPSTPTNTTVSVFPFTGDINQDGVVDILDLVLVAGQLGQTGQNEADINGDGVVNILDLVLVAGMLGNEAAAPSLHLQALAMLTPADVQGWLTQAQHRALTTPPYLRGIAVLEQLLAALRPKQTALLPNYPNPFNPETWIPYHLAQAADVQVTIYDAKGVMVRQLDIEHQPAGYYTAQSKAAYWDGCNESGESVASGVYFYQLRAGDYTATRRMVIVK